MQRVGWKGKINVLDNGWDVEKFVYGWMEMLARSILAHTLRGGELVEEKWILDFEIWMEE